MSKLEQRLPFKPGGVVWVYNPGNQEAKAGNCQPRPPNRPCQKKKKNLEAVMVSHAAIPSIQDSEFKSELHNDSRTSLGYNGKTLSQKT